MAERCLGIFETQRRSEWVQNMLEQAKRNFGHADLSWRRRALLAIPEAGIAGKTLTTVEMEDALIPLIGPAVDVASRSAIAKIGCKQGIMVETGTLRRPDGYPNSYREYRIIGHMERDGHKFRPIVSC